MALPKKSVDDMNNWYPCYDINLAFEDPNFKGDAIDVLNYENCPVVDRFWVMARPDMVPVENIMHQFGIDIMGELSPSASMANALLTKADWMAGSVTDEAMEAVQTAEQTALDILEVENKQAHAEYARQVMAGNDDDTAVKAHDVLFYTQSTGVKALSIDPRDASWGSVVMAIKVDTSLSEWARLHMISLLEA